METTPCPTCGTPASGKFCSSCGAQLGPATCTGCGTSLSAGAGFCHRCGRPAGASGSVATSRGKLPWLLAGTVTVILLGWLIFRINRGVEVAPPPAGQNAGANAPFAGAGGTPPDLSQMTGREAFLRLHDRIMGSLEQGDTASATQFSPMAIQAYAALTPAEADYDIRYHATTLLIGSGDLRGAVALTDSLAREVPGHLFVDMLRAGIAEGRNDTAGAKRAYAKFLADWDAQLATGRQEYVDHRPLLDAFKERAGQLK